MTITNTGRLDINDIPILVDTDMPATSGGYIALVAPDRNKYPLLTAVSIGPVEAAVCPNCNTGMHIIRGKRRPLDSDYAKEMTDKMSLKDYFLNREKRKQARGSEEE